MFYVLESPLNWGHGSEVVVQHSSIGGISASVIMWTFFLAAGQVMISHAWTVCTDAWLVGHHQPDINIYILNENFFINFKNLFWSKIWCMFYQSDFWHFWIKFGLFIQNILKCLIIMFENTQYWSCILIVGIIFVIDRMRKKTQRKNSRAWLHQVCHWIKKSVVPRFF